MLPAGSMMKQFTKEKQKQIFAFIDSNNVYLGIKHQGWKIDLIRLRKYLWYKYGVSKAFLFIGYVQGRESFYTELQEAGYTVILKPTVEYLVDGKPIRKGNVDAELVLHAMIHFQGYDRAVILSGDGDFYCLVEYLEQKGKLGKVLVPNGRRYSALLRKFRKYIAPLGGLKKKIGDREAK